MGSEKGFPDGVKFTPVPSPLFGEVLRDIEDIIALKCLLRIIWIHSQKKGFPRFVTLAELVHDRTLLEIITASQSESLNILYKALGEIMALGVLLQHQIITPEGTISIYSPNTQEGRRAMNHLVLNGIDSSVMPDPDVTDIGVPNRSSIFSIYEQNIGIVTPIIAEELKEAQEIYPENWIEDAFREAVMSNKRNWRYIGAILKRWEIEGKDDGKFGGHTKKADAREWIRRHGLQKPN